jgi:hypothetical protein
MFGDTLTPGQRFLTKIGKLHKPIARDILCALTDFQNVLRRLLEAANSGDEFAQRAVEVCTFARDALSALLQIHHYDLRATWISYAFGDPVKLTTLAQSTPFDSRPSETMDEFLRPILDPSSGGDQQTIFTCNNLVQWAGQLTPRVNLNTVHLYFRSVLIVGLASRSRKSGFLVFDSPRANAFPEMPESLEFVNQNFEYGEAIKECPSTLMAELLASMLNNAIELVADNTENKQKSAAESGFPSGRSIEFYSVMISYSHRDEEFVKCLYSRLKESKVTVWCAREDIKGGNRILEQIDQAIRIHDKILLVLSPNSINSNWVHTEMFKTRKRELKENRKLIFPIKLCSYDIVREWECFDSDSGRDLAKDIREYFIPDFSEWETSKTFDDAFKKLLHDLTRN